ncbi:hypothetical protein EOD39_10086 [Acipenser ruthenus]|uniref:HAT C-terminal dimerisation domain-containing protein n=1 Tax=Acipenser ruthenus TaxID=7906 RepID=A0A444TYM7_ACIRT|nr:hypothetical protein EOD39_10086 [Acipenser ruthenus]
MVNKEVSLFNKIKILIPSVWQRPLPDFYGEDRVRELNICFSGVKQEYRDFKEQPELHVQQILLKLTNAVDTLAVSNAECERGFSEINDIVTPLRKRLTIEHVSSQIFISLVGPPLNSWASTKYVKKWKKRSHKEQAP